LGAFALVCVFVCGALLGEALPEADFGWLWLGGALELEVLAGVFTVLVAASAVAVARGGRAEGRSDGRFAGGRDDAPDAADFFVVFCAATLRAGGADERRPAVCLVALT
jgi:hypothetical protein